MKIIESTISTMRAIFSALPDKRKTGGRVYSMQDIAMGAFSLFFMQSESFLAFQHALNAGKGTSNAQTLFGITQIPTDNHIRNILDAVPPPLLAPCFDEILAQLQQHNGLAPFKRLDNRVLIALDGTQYFSSQKLNCPHCLTRTRSNGQTDYYHAMLAATMVAPGHNLALPLMPEFIENTDGMAKQDCERNAATRWLHTHGAKFQPLRPVFLGDALFACQPIAKAMRDCGGDFILSSKPDSHKTLYDFMCGASICTHSVRKKEGKKQSTHVFRWFCEAPLRESKDAMDVHWFEVEILDGSGKTTYKNAFITSLPVNIESIEELAACARARWKIENESFNVLKNNGYALEHNFGHGQQHLAKVFATLNMLAFALHTLSDACEEMWKKGRVAKRSRQRFFEHMRTLTTYLVFPNWESLLHTIVHAKPPPAVLEKNS